MTKTIAFAITVIFALMMTSTALAFAAPQPNGQPFQALDTRITAIEQDNVQSDSFFDVFTELGFTADSFFDVFTEMQQSAARSDSFFDVFTELGFTADSFFDVFTELESTTGDPDFDLLRNGVPDLDNEAAARVAADSQLQTRVFGFCPPGSSIRQVNSDGSVSCEIDDVGTGSSGRLIVVQRSGPTTVLSGGGAFASSFAPCLSGEMVVGGGYRASPATVNVSSESMEFAGAEGWGWFVNAYYESGTAPGFITALAECATIVP